MLISLQQEKKTDKEEDDDYDYEEDFEVTLASCITACR